MPVKATGLTETKGRSQSLIVMPARVDPILAGVKEDPMPSKVVLIVNVVTH